MAAIYFEMVTAVVVFVVLQAICMALLSLKPVKEKMDGMLNVFSRLIIYKSAMFVGNQEHAIQESSSSYF